MEGATMTSTMSSSATQGGPQFGPDLPVTMQEEKELRRVFDFLCDFSKRSKIQLEMKELQSYLTLARQKVQNQINSGMQVNLDRVDENERASQERLNQLGREIYDMENNPDKKITFADVHDMLKRLGHKPVKSEVEEMIWEVDEDLDMALNWSEFKLMFTRNIRDKTGLEPLRMYLLTQFLIYDHNDNGLVSVDETMNMLYTRYGRAQMEVKLKELFGEDLKETGKEGGEITFPRFMKAVEKTQMTMFWRTTKGRIVASKMITKPKA